MTRKVINPHLFSNKSLKLAQGAPFEDLNQILVCIYMHSNFIMERSMTETTGTGIGEIKCQKDLLLTRVHSLHPVQAVLEPHF